MIYRAAKQRGLSIESSDWDKGPWKKNPALVMGNFMGSKSDHFPRAEVKVAYDANALGLMFRIEDQIIIPGDDCARIRRVHSLPSIVDVEIQ